MTHLRFTFSATATACTVPAAMIYQNVLKDFADHLQADLILLPSSVHEVLLTPNLPETSYEALSSMVTSSTVRRYPGGTAFQPGLPFFPQRREVKNRIQRTGTGGRVGTFLKNSASNLIDQYCKTPGKSNLKQDHLHRKF